MENADETVIGAADDDIQMDWPIDAFDNFLIDWDAVFHNNQMDWGNDTAAGFNNNQMDLGNDTADEANAEQQQQHREETVKNDTTIPFALIKRMIKANCGKLRVSQEAVLRIQMNATNLVKIITREAALKAIRENKMVMKQGHVQFAIHRHAIHRHKVDAVIPQQMPIPDRDPETVLMENE